MAVTLQRTDLIAKPLIAGEAMRGVPVDARSPASLEIIGTNEEADEQLLNLALDITSKWPGSVAASSASTCSS